MYSCQDIPEVNDIVQPLIQTLKVDLTYCFLQIASNQNRLSAASSPSILTDKIQFSLALPAQP